MKRQGQESAYMEMARENLEFWMECHQEAVKEKNLLLDRLRHTEESEWRSMMFRWLTLVEHDQEKYRRAIENAEDIFRQIEAADSDVHGYRRQGVLV